MAVLLGPAPARGRILDVRCGYGVRARLLAVKSLGRKVVGIDTDEAAVRIARAAARDELNVSFDRTDDLAGLDGTFDTILLVDCLDRTNADAERTVALSAERLAAAGNVIVRARVSGGGRKHVDRSEAEFEPILPRAGFSDVTERPDLTRNGECVWVLRRKPA